MTAGAGLWRAGSAGRRLLSRAGRLHVLVLLAGATALAALVLSCLRVTPAEFGMEGRTRSFAAELAKSATTGSLVVRDASVAGVRSAGANPALPTDVYRGDEIALAAPPDAGPITLERARIPAGWTLRMEAGTDADLLLLASPAADGGARERPSLRLLMPRGTRLTVGSPDERRSARLAADTVLTLTVDYLDLRLRRLAGPAGDVFQLLHPAALRFERDEADYGDGSVATLSFGTVDRGRLWVADAEGVPAVTAIDRLRLAGIRDGVMRPVALDGGAIAFGARGAAATITNTPAATPIDLRPTRLDPLVNDGLLRVMLGVFSFFASLQIANILRQR